MLNFNTEDFDNKNNGAFEATGKSFGEKKIEENPLMDVSCTGILGTPEERYMFISFSNGRAYTEMKVVINKDGTVKGEPEVVSSRDVTFEEMDAFKAYVLKNASDFIDRAKGINVFKSFMS